MGYLHRGSLVLVNRLDRAHAFRNPQEALKSQDRNVFGVITGIERFWLNSSGVGFGVYRFVEIVIAKRCVFR